MKNHVLVVGSGGFIGSELSSALQKEQNTVYEVSSSYDACRVRLPTQISMKKFLDDDLDDINIDILIHCAGPRRTAENAHESLMKVVVAKAIKLGVKKIIYMSSVAAHFTTLYKDLGKIPIDKNLDHYGRDKLASEKTLIQACENSSLNYLILRLPLVYGQNAKGKFQVLYSLAKFGFVLPNDPFNEALKSFLYIKNLTNIVECIIKLEKCWNVSINVTDDDDQTPAQFSRKISLVFSKKRRIITLPRLLIKLSMFFIGKSKVVEDLTHPSTVDISNTKAFLSWRPKYNVNEAMKDMKRRKNDASS